MTGRSVVIAGASPVWQHDYSVATRERKQVNVGLGIAIGMTVGAAIGAAAGNYVVWLAAGAGVGGALGYAMRGK